MRCILTPLNRWPVLVCHYIPPVELLIAYAQPVTPDAPIQDPIIDAPIEDPAIYVPKQDRN